MSKLKQLWGWLVAVVGGLIGLLLFILSRKNSEVKALKAKIDLAKTEKETDILEAEIKDLKDDKNNLNKTNQELDKALEKVEEKRKTVAEDAKKLKDPKEIADYWENN